MHNAVVSKLIAASRGSPCDSMASCKFRFESCQGFVMMSFPKVKCFIFILLLREVFSRQWYEGLSMAHQVLKSITSVNVVDVSSMDTPVHKHDELT